jgi:glycosyltransferase involved in cell wall biosynthesis
MSSPAVTVLMPVYNGEKYIHEAVESVLSQTFSDYEFLIIDDGSSDSGMDIVRTYKDERIRILSNEGNIGIEESLNRGIREARGKYIARMDADDISLPRRFERQVTLMEDREDVAVCGTYFEYFGSVNGRARSLAAHNAEIRCRLLFGNAMAHPTVLLRRDVMLGNDFFYDRSFHGAEDYDLWVRMSERFKLANIPEILIRYRTHNQQVSAYRAELQKKAASAIRARQLRNLVPDVTVDEMMLFDRIAEKTIEEKTSYLEATRRLFEKIIEANGSKRIYDQGILCGILFGMWWRLCNLCCVEGLDAWRIYRRSSMHARKFDSLKFLIKCGVRYGKQYSRDGRRPG